MPRKSGRDGHRSALEREEHLERVSRLHAMGYTLVEIAADLGVSKVTVFHDVQLIKKRYRESQLEAHAALVREKLEVLRHVRREAYAAWERSKLDATRRTTRRSPVVSVDPDDGSGGGGKGRKGKRKGRRGSDPTPDQLRDMFVSEILEVVEGRLPASEYLSVILKTVEQERALLGLDEALKVNMSVATLNWSDLFPLETPREAEPVRVVDLPRPLGPADRNGSRG